MGGYVPLEKVYSYEPIANKEAATMLEKYVDGVQGNLWTEEVPTPEHAEYMLYPRMLLLPRWDGHAIDQLTITSETALFML